MKKSINGFTLIEVLVSIAILGLIVLSLSKINLNYKINIQNFYEFNNSIASNIESVRNNAIYGRGIPSGNNVINPTNWIIDITPTSFSTKYNDTIDYENQTELKYNQDLYEIEKIICKTLGGSSEIALSTENTLKLTFDGKNITSNCPNNGKIVEITTSLKSNDLKQKIIINILSGIVTKEKL